jgi:hypothetical protein
VARDIPSLIKFKRRKKMLPNVLKQILARLQRTGDTISGNLIPDTSLTRDLGSASLPYKNVYAGNITSNTTASGHTVIPYPRERLSSTTAFYVAATGDDTKDGRSAANAMKTFNALMTRLYQEYDLNGQTITINVGAGTYSNVNWSIVRSRLTNSQNINIVCAGVDQTIIDAATDGTTNREAISVIDKYGWTYYTSITGLTIKNAANAIRILGAWVRLGDVKFGPHNTTATYYDIVTGYGARVTSLGSAATHSTWTFAEGTGGKPVACIFCQEYSYVHLNYTDIVIASATSATYFLRVAVGSCVVIGNATNTIFTGASLLTGRKAYVYINSILETTARGADVLPGTTAAMLATNGVIDNYANCLTNAILTTGNQTKEGTITFSNPTDTRHTSINSTGINTDLLKILAGVTTAGTARNAQITFQALATDGIVSTAATIYTTIANRVSADGVAHDSAMIIKPNGALYAGSGESASTYRNNMNTASTAEIPAGIAGIARANDEAEHVWLTSDNNIYFVVGVQTWANTKALILNTTTFCPAVSGIFNLGSTALPFGTVYANNLVTNTAIQGKTAGGRNATIYPRERLGSATSFWISPSGNNTASGRANTTDPATGAMQTFNALMTRLYQEYDLNGVAVTINVAAGTYAESWQVNRLRLPNAGNIIIIGAGVESTIVNPTASGATTGATGINIYGSDGYNHVTVVSNLTITNMGVAISCNSVRASLGNIKFGPHFGVRTQDTIAITNAYVATYGGTTDVHTTLTFAYGSNPPRYMFYLLNRAIFSTTYINMTMVGSFQVTRFLYIAASSYMAFANTTNTVITGAANVTGAKAVVELASFLHTGGRADSALPGSTASVTASAGVINNFASGGAPIPVTTSGALGQWTLAIVTNYSGLSYKVSAPAGGTWAYIYNTTKSVDTGNSESPTAGSYPSLEAGIVAGGAIITYLNGLLGNNDGPPSNCVCWRIT